MKNVHPCTFFIDEFEAKPQTSLLLRTSGIRAAFACEAEQRTRMSVVLSRSKFFGEKNLSLNSVHGRMLFNSSALYAAHLCSINTGRFPLIPEAQG